MRNELDYAMALSAENLGLSRRALPLWQKLAAKDDIPLYEKAYATYFLAKDAERRKDIKDAYDYNKAALGLFSRLEDERSDKADPERVKEAVSSLMDICEVANRIPEALDWVERYNAFVPEDSPEHAGVRFRESRLYRKMGDTAKSRALLEQIVRAEPDSPFGRAAASELRTFDVSRDLDRFVPMQ
jgi:tetratricopeptide (TPR) repeat protein